MRTVKHVNITATNTNDVDGTLNLYASTTSGGTYHKIGSATFFEGQLTFERFSNIAYKYLKTEVVIGASASTYNIVVYMSS